jgi:hypothetical protein
LPRPPEACEPQRSCRHPAAAPKAAAEAARPVAH